MAKTKKEVVEDFVEETAQHEAAPAVEVTTEVTPESYTVTFTVADIDRLFGFGEFRRYADQVLKTLISL